MISGNQTLSALFGKNNVIYNPIPYGFVTPSIIQLSISQGESKTMYRIN